MRSWSGQTTRGGRREKEARSTENSKKIKKEILGKRLVARHSQKVGKNVKTVKYRWKKKNLIANTEEIQTMEKTGKKGRDTRERVDGEEGEGDHPLPRHHQRSSQSKTLSAFLFCYLDSPIAVKKEAAQQAKDRAR